MKSFIPEAKEAFITGYALESESTDVLSMANEMMRNSAIRFHAPEHHYLLAATLVSAYCNATGRKEDKKELLEKILCRAQIISPGSCGFYGVCGNVLALGAVTGLLLQATPLSAYELKLVNQAAAEAQHSMATFEGPRCCKRATYQNLAVAVRCLNRLLNLELTYPAEVVCQFSEGNETCSKEACPFHAGRK